MANNSRIEWTEATWNPVTGCTKVSPGCKNCYAEIMAKRLKAMGSPRYADGFKVTLHPDLLDRPASWKKPKQIFVNSMSDLFHKDVPTDFILQVFEAMCAAPQHTYQILTKRPERLAELQSVLPIRPFIWLGVSVEGADYKHRIDHLLSVKSAIRFLSLEPLLDDLGPLPLSGIHWVIVGGESGPKSRPIKKEWVQNIQRQCSRQDVAFFFKQWGGKNKKKAGRQLNGQIYNEYPSFALAAE
ncbi:MAG TPA: phage Gp37/Gp68 family protein [Rhodospirillales bacterium]|nr:phage Gp37/Gp68 family protein [Rhodospirillales bacterium]